MCVCVGGGCVCVCVCVCVCRRGGGLGLLVSMVISLCVHVFVGRTGDKGVEELKVIVEGMASWFKGKIDEEITC